MFWCLLSTIVHSLEMWFQRTVIRLKVKDNDYIMVYRMNLNYLSIFFSTDTNPYNAQVYAWFNINVFCYKTLCKIHFLHLWQRENMLSIFFYVFLCACNEFIFCFHNNRVFQIRKMKWIFAGVVATLQVL